MYTPDFRKKRNGVPVLSKNDIDIIGESFVADFCPEAMKTPMAVDIDGFAQDYLGLQQDFQYLSHNGVYLGMMVFNDTSKVPIYDPNTKRAEYVTEKARTIIIDNLLLDDNQERRYRFTMGHEVAHDIFHSGYYGYNPSQATLFEGESTPMVQCRIDTTKSAKKLKAEWTDMDWMEWQANRFSSAILMPASMVRQLIASNPEETSAFRAAYWIMSVVHTFIVSVQAAEIRLRDLGLISDFSKHDIENELTIFAK